MCSTNLCLLSSLVACAGLNALCGERQLIADPAFRIGCRIQSPVPGKVLVVKTITLAGSESEPVWHLAQWHSRFPIEDSRLAPVAPGVFRLANVAKELIWAPRDHRNGQLVMGLNASAEYGDKSRQRGEQWPHLLLSQRFEKPPRMSDLKTAQFAIEVRLLRSTSQRTEGYTPRLHAAQFQVFFNIQNLNRASAGYGDYLYFGIPLYDSRRRIPSGFRAPDQANKYIFTPAGSVYTEASAHDKTWVKVEKNLLPLMRDALDAAWEAGFLKDSRDLADYRISAMNMGWELPGGLDVAMQVRDLALTVETVD